MRFLDQSRTNTLWMVVDLGAILRGLDSSLNMILEAADTESAELNSCELPKAV